MGRAHYLQHVPFEGLGSIESWLLGAGYEITGTELKFHLETTPDSAKVLVENCGDELVEGRFLQSATEILSASPEYYTSNNGLMADLLASLQRGSA